MSPPLVVPEAAARRGLTNPRVDVDCHLRKTKTKKIGVKERRERRGRCRLCFGSWNVRSLVEREGGIATACVSGRVVEDKKCHRVVAELRRLGVAAAGLQETHWFGCEMYDVDGFTVLSSGRPFPDDGASRLRGEGVAIVLNDVATSAWKAGGCVWKAVDSRLVSARLKFSQRDGSAKWITLLCAYAPTFSASRSCKDTFFSHLQDMLLEVPSSDQCILVGDFNARVGSGVRGDLWDGVRGCHGYGSVNPAGVELLSFAAINNLSIVNTWFPKRDIFKRTWQHPGSLSWHCIDYVLVRGEDRHLCKDVSVVRSAECGSDHQLLCLMFELSQPIKQPTTKKSSRPRRFDVEKLSARMENSTTTTADMYRSALAEELLSKWDHSAGVDQKWEALRDAITTAACSTLGFNKRRQPDWFRESKDVIQPFLEKRSKAYDSWIKHGQQKDIFYSQFKGARSEARHAVVKAKEDWILAKAQEATANRFDGSVVWRCIADLQSAGTGLCPTRVSSVTDESGRLCVSAEEQSQRWRRHFSAVLNIESSFDARAISDIAQRPVAEDRAGPPSLLEIRAAMSRLQNGKAAGASSILPELLKGGGCALETKLLELFDDAWETEKVPQEWVDATLVPIPKKGDLTTCDNWRGISLLDVVGKVLARVIQTRLQDMAADFLPESQGGFRRGRSCTDMIFSVRQLIEKTIEHKAKGFFIFIDLKKAYDSVPRECLWQVLLRAGVPGKLVNIIRSFHTSMTAVLRVNGITTDPISVNNGLRQGCTMAPVLFNIYMWAVVSCWQQRLKDHPGAGVEFRFQCTSDLYRKSRRSDPLVKLTECQFADDSALLAVTRYGAELALRLFAEVASQFGLTVSATKTKFLVVGSNISDDDRAPLQLGDAEIACLPEFRYLGSLVHQDSRSSHDIAARVASASRACGSLQKAIFSNPHLAIHTKRCVFNACVLSLLLYGSECWTPLQSDIRKLTTFHMRCVRSILGVSRLKVWSDRITNAELLAKWGDPESLGMKLQRRRLEWLGHVARMEESRMPKQLLFGTLLQRRPAHGTRKRWKDCAMLDIRSRAIDSWYDIANQSRPEWRRVCASAVELPLPGPVVCPVCSRSFSRQSDCVRHKCLAERAKPIAEQPGACQCDRCGRWLKSHGGLAVHKCASAAIVGSTTISQEPPHKECCAAHCGNCNRCFRSLPGRKRHRCTSSCPRPSSQTRQQFEHVCSCSRRFRRTQDLKRHQASCSFSPSNYSPMGTT